MLRDTGPAAPRAVAGGPLCPGRGARRASDKPFELARSVLDPLLRYAGTPDVAGSRCREDHLVSSAALLAYLAAAILIAWGLAHLAPTRTIAASFGAISLDNRRILVMEWVAEGITHISIGLLVILATAIEGAADAATAALRRAGRSPRGARGADRSDRSSDPGDLVSRLPIRPHRFGGATHSGHDRLATQRAHAHPTGRHGPMRAARTCFGAATSISAALTRVPKCAVRRNVLVVAGLP